MKQAIEFIILGTTKVGEKSLVLHTLSSEYGRRSFIVSVSKSSSMALYLPLNILSGEVSDNHLSDLWRVSGLRAEYPLNGIRSSVLKNSVCLFMSEVLYRVLRDGEYSEELYAWARRSILTLDQLGADYANFHLIFLIELSSVLGFSPRTEDLMPFAGERLEDISSLLTLPYEQALLLPLSGARRSEIAEILLEYLSFHLDSRLNIRSLPVLRELFA
ncbi:MAG: DNA repair protein RecO C-terminal domain-containing protein [Bacteroidales bacterium]|nr:DNA repair protein RecO C-terminal domain-containing protein [Bacteroidales bacterium]